MDFKQGGREGGRGGRPADEIWVDFKVLKLLYRLNYLDFYFVYYHCSFTPVLELHSVGFCQVKIYFKMCFEVQNSVAIFISIPTIGY